LAAVANATGQRTPDFATPRPPPPQPRPSTGDGRGGWLSDVLARASREETPPPESRAEFAGRPASVGALGSISIDIARMVNHEAAAELWNQHQRGENAAFTRRLYTPQGQQTFEEIRRKYRTDGDFKQTIDQYVAEFERLLDEVERDDPGSAVALSYLTSETGKVYTMLAHAIGRFD
jgi:hypothetical protein